MENLLKRYLSGDRRALARLITIVENEETDLTSLLDKVYYHTGKAYRIGITGPPGAGKSTIVDQLSKLYRKANKTVGIIAVDPTSPFTGGALLGDRVRMNDLATDPGVFIRSMASRGKLGGLARRTQEVADLLDGFGMDFIIFETVGVGQAELDIIEAADSVVVVLVPESGDSIQAMKAGLMEIGDIFVVNKADREGAERHQTEIELVLQYRENPTCWKPPVIPVIASQGSGIEQLMKLLADHFQFLNKHQLRSEKQKARIENYLKQLVEEKVLRQFWDQISEKKLSKLIEQIINKKRSPYAVCEQLINSFFSEGA